MNTNSEALTRVICEYGPSGLPNSLGLKVSMWGIIPPRCLRNRSPFPDRQPILFNIDFNGDGKSDLLFENPNTGGVWELRLNGTGIASQGADDVADKSIICSVLLTSTATESRISFGATIPAD